MHRPGIKNRIVSCYSPPPAPVAGMIFCADLIGKKILPFDVEAADLLLLFAGVNAVAEGVAEGAAAAFQPAYSVIVSFESIAPALVRELSVFSSIFLLK